MVDVGGGDVVERRVQPAVIVVLHEAREYTLQFPRAVVDLPEAHEKWRAFYKEAHQRAFCKEEHRSELDAWVPEARRLAPRPGEAVEGAGAGEWAAEEAGRGPGPRQHDSQRGGLGKLLSPSRRRQAVAYVRRRLPVSERRACRVIGHARSTHRHAGAVPADEPRLVDRMIELATKYGRYGYRRITGLLRGEGWLVNHKRVERLWRREGLKVPQKQPKRGRLWLADGSCVRRRPTYRHHVWAYDFVAERTHDGRPLKILAVVDEYSRECLALVVARRLRSIDVLETLAGLFVTHGVPAHIRWITVLSSRRHSCGCGSRLWTSRHYSSNPAVRGKTAMWNRSTASYAMNCWTARSSSRWRKRRS